MEPNYFDLGPLTASLLQDDLASQSRLIESLQGNRNSLLEQKRAMIQETTPTWGGVLGSSLLPAIAALAGGGFSKEAAAPAAQFAVAGGQGYFNNLEANRKEKTQILDAELKSAEGQLNDYQQNRTLLRNSLFSAGLAQDLARQKGEIINTPEHEQAQREELDLAIEKAQAHGARGGLDAEVPDELLSRLVPDVADREALKASGAKITYRILDVLQRNTGLENQTKQEERRQQQFDFGKGKTQSFEYPQIPGTSTSEKGNNDFQKMAGGKNRAVVALDNIKKLLSQGDPITGPKAGEIASNSSELFAALRDLQKTGMRLEGREAKALAAMMPSSFGSQQDWTDYFAGRMRSTDSAQFIDSVKGVLRRAMAAEARAVNKYDPQSRDAYEPEFVKRLSDAGAEWAKPPRPDPKEYRAAGKTKEDWIKDVQAWEREYGQ